MISFGSLVFLLAASGPFARAVLPVISSGERVVLFEDFTTNTQNWTQVAVINGTGSTATGKAGSEDSTWFT